MISHSIPSESMSMVLSKEKSFKSGWKKNRFAICLISLEFLFQQCFYDLDTVSEMKAFIWLHWTNIIYCQMIERWLVLFRRINIWTDLGFYSNSKEAILKTIYNMGKFVLFHSYIIRCTTTPVHLYFAQMGLYCLHQHYWNTLMVAF